MYTQYNSDLWVQVVGPDCLGYRERRGTVTERVFEIAMNGMGFFFSQKEMAMFRNRYGDHKGLINFDKLVSDLEMHSDLSQVR